MIKGENWELSSQVVTPNTEAAILARIIQSEERELTPEVARYLGSMKLPARDEERVQELSARARQLSAHRDPFGRDAIQGPAPSPI